MMVPSKLLQTENSGAEWNKFSGNLRGLVELFQIYPGLTSSRIWLFWRKCKKAETGRVCMLGQL